MSMLLTILLFFVLPFAKCDESVKMAILLYRHGHRTPVHPYPTDPYKNESLWPVQFGELTNLGKRQHYALGQWLRKRYSHLLSEKFVPNEIYVRSTDVDRTLMSALSNLAGMYPPVGPSVWDEQLLWQPIPVHTVPEAEDQVLAMKKPCPAYDKEMKHFKNSKEYKEKLSKYQSLMDYLSAYTGVKVKDYNHVEYIFGTLSLEYENNFTLPNWTRTVYPEKMREPACHAFTVPTGTPLLARLKVGPFLKEITDRMKGFVAQTGSQPNVVVYSGHDDTVSAVLHSLGLFDNRCPAFTATILIELLNDSNNSTTVRISYRNSTEIVEPHVLTIPYCGETCPLDRFIALYKNIITVDWANECRTEFPNLLGGMFVMGLVIILLVYTTHKLYFAKFAASQYKKNIQYAGIEFDPNQKVYDA